MPKLDKAGPLGQGPMTGRQMGNCTGAKRMGLGKGRGCGCNGGFFGRMFYTEEERVELLKVRELMLEDELKAIREELSGKMVQE